MAARKKPTHPEDPIPTVTRYQAAKMLNVSGRTIDRWLEDGRLPGDRHPIHGTWAIPLASVQAHLADRGGGLPEGDDDASHGTTTVGLLAHAAVMQKQAGDAFQWLIRMQQEVIASLSTELGHVQEAYSGAVRAEAKQRLETELALRQESRKDKALDEALPFAERILTQSMQGRAGSKVLDALARLNVEQWDTIKGMAVELLEMPASDVEQLDALRRERIAEKEKETNGTDNLSATPEPAHG